MSEDKTDILAWLDHLFKKAKEETDAERLFVFDFEKKHIFILFNQKTFDEKKSEFKIIRYVTSLEPLELMEETSVVKLQTVLDRFKNGRYRFISTKLSVIVETQNMLNKETIGDGFKSLLFN